MTRVSCTIEIQALAEIIWPVISDFGAAGDYLVGVINCTVESQGLGTLRMLTSANSSTVVETSKRWTKLPSG